VIEPLARRLQILSLSLLALQLLGSDWASPLCWGSLTLVVMASLKLAKAQRPADLRRGLLAQLIALGVLAGLNPNLGPGLVQAATGLVLVAALLAQESGGGGNLRQMLNRSVQLLVVCLPLLVLLFLFIPRLGPPWPQAELGRGRTGLSEQLDPGAIAQLALDPSPALRISPAQEQDLPPADQRYWRVRVLDRFDGQRWRAAPAQGPAQAWTPPAPAPPGAAQQLWLVEPSPLSALPWGGSGVPLNPQITSTAKGELLGPWQTRVRRSYGLAASNQPPAWQLHPPARSDLDFAAGSNPQLEALAEGWRQQLAPAQRLAAAQALFQGQPFRYTLQPPPLGDVAPLDQFLFASRAGFCEHFASAFTGLMRAAAVPARVVVGYQGGSWVPANLWGRGYLEVLQQDAHAWSEVWLADQGWVRIDPTAWVAPARIQAGLRSGLAGQWADLGLLSQGLPWLRPLTRSWTNLDLAWNQLLRYDQFSQDQLMQRWLGPFRSWQGLVLVLGLALALALAVWILGLLRPTPRQEQQRRRLDRSLSRLAPLNLVPQPGESLPAFCRRAAAQLPELAPGLERLQTSYERLRFAPRGQERARALELARSLGAADRELAAAASRLGRRPVERLQSPEPP
jgi:transglutaminase-like putative cysteine protease